MDQHDILRGRWFWNWLTLIRVLLHQLLTFRLQLLLTYIKGSHSHHHQSSGAGTGALGGQMTPGNLLRELGVKHILTTRFFFTWKPFWSRFAFIV